MCKPILKLLPFPHSPELSSNATISMAQDTETHFTISDQNGSEILRKWGDRPLQLQWKNWAWWDEASSRWVEDLVEDRTTMQKLPTDGTPSPPVIYSGLPREGGEYYGLVSETHPVSNGDLPDGLGDWDRR